VSRTLILKLGGELLETPEQRAHVAALAAAVAARRRPLVIVHGGGRAIDVELERRGIAPRKIDGLRVTDAATLETVVSVLAGSANTALVAALVAQGVPAVGLTGVDAGLGRAVRAGRHAGTSGDAVDLGAVGDPADVESSLLELLLVHGYVPVVASLGIEVPRTQNPGPRTPDSPVLNVNADVMACRIAAAIEGSDLVIAGTTPGVLDGRGVPMPLLDVHAIDAIIADGTATAGMVAKLSACRAALASGVASVRIIDGRGLGADHGVDVAPGTMLVTGLMGPAHPPGQKEGRALARPGRQ
jgi:acetylglutamate kinase